MSTSRRHSSTAQRGRRSSSRSMSITHSPGLPSIAEPASSLLSPGMLTELPGLNDDIASTWQAALRSKRSRVRPNSRKASASVLDWDLAAGQIVRHVERSLGVSLVLNTARMTPEMVPRGEIRIAPVSLPPPDNYFMVGPPLVISPCHNTAVNLKCSKGLL